ncbi:MAG: hypothetical protein Q8J88_05990 [Bacteroidales bacterium]|nr:hypothetical protein [Bacteroidales bacterium]
MKARQILAIFTLLLAGFLTSCEYEFIVPDVPVIDPEVPIKFSEQIVPIFTSGNACTACHKTGSTPPDLTTDRAYNAIVPALVNPADPESSSIYWFAHPNSSSHNWKKYSAADAAIILEWIKQGAKNN